MTDSFAWLGGMNHAQYLLYGVIAALLMAAIVPWTAGPRAGWRRFAEWLVVTALVSKAVGAIVGVFLNISFVASAAGDAASDPGAGEPGEMMFMLSTIAIPIVGYLLTALLYRRMRWEVLEQRTGWRLDGWRRWPVFLLAGPFFQWPFFLLVSILLYASSAGPGVAEMSSTELTRSSLLHLLRDVALLGLGLVPVVVGWPLRKPDLELADPVTDGSAGARRLSWIGGVGVLMVGLDYVVQTYWELFYRYAAFGDVPPAFAVPWTEWLALAVALAALALLGRPWWRDWLEDFTGRIWSFSARVLAALTLGAWLAWPVPIAGELLAARSTVAIDPQYARWAAWLVFAVVVAALLGIGRVADANAGNQ